MKYTLVKGTHYEKTPGGDHKVFKTGQTFESKRDLVALFPNKFRKADAPASEGVSSVPEPQVSNTPSEPTPPPAPEPAPPPATVAPENVTETFPDAKELDLLVFKMEDGYFFVANKETPTEPRNKHTLKTVKAVEKFIGEVLEEKA